MTKLIKKEWKELFKTGKIYALLFVFLFFSISSPFIAKFTPEIVKSLIKEQGVEGILIKLPSPTWKDSFIQFFKNLNQLIFLVLVIVFIGSISEEKNRGTAMMVVVRGVDRRKWAVSKFIFQILITLILLFISYFICFYYSFMLFPETEFIPSLSTTILYAIYIFFILSLTIFSSSLGNNAIQSGGIFFGIFILFNILSIFPQINSYNPLYLSSLENQWILQAVDWNLAIKPILSTFIISFIFLYLGALYFNHQEL